MAVDKTKGHPYLFMFVLRETLNKLAGKRVTTTKRFTEVWPSVEESLPQTIFSQKFQSASENERGLMVEVAKTNREFVSPSEFGKTAGSNRDVHQARTEGAVASP
jgi:hypothetical protein